MYTDSLRQMLDQMHHRGPDERGEFISDQAVLGMDRLAIVDCEGRSQPIWNEDHTICVVANGEIYNHRVLRELLSSNGASISDRVGCGGARAPV